MQQGSYEFDPCSIDGSDKEVSIDNWKPKKKKNDFRDPSKWRQEQNAKGYGYMTPGLDDIHKIKAYLKKKCSDCEIMATFAINADTLFAIKNNRYDPVDGKIDNQMDVLFKKVELLDKRVDICKLLIKNQAENLILDNNFCTWLDGFIRDRIALGLNGDNCQPLRNPDE